MHVLILPSWYFPADSDEIRGRMFHQLASSLRKKSIDARIFFVELNPASPLKREFHFAIENCVPTWRVRQWWTPKLHAAFIRSWINKYVRLLQEYIEKEGRPDLIHAHSYLSGFVAEALKKQTGIPFILTERSSQFISGKIPFRYRSFIRNTFGGADMITAVSPGLRDYLKKFTSVEIVIVPNYCDADIFFYDPSIQKNKVFTFVSIGEPMRAKGLDILMHAFGKLKQSFPLEKMQVLLMDQIADKNDLLKIASASRIADDITWTGLVPQRKVAEILRRSHVLVSASRIETFGKAILEAQACGLPVVATRTDGAVYILTKPEQGIFVAINNVDELSDALREMYLHYGRYDAQKITGAVAQFSEEKVIGQWLEIYHKVAG